VTGGGAWRFASSARRWRVGPALLGIFLSATLARAAEWQLEPAQSRAQFAVRIFRLIPVEGRFGDVRGEISADKVTGRLSVHAHIATATLTMASESQAHWVKSEHFLDVSRYPEITFDSDSFAGETLAAGAVLPGRLTLHGRTNPVALTLTAGACDLKATGNCSLEAGTSIERSAFALGSYRGLIGDQVSLSLKVLARSTTPAGTGAEKQP
jgi:polyisoprenoid-binding protein YceI